MGPFLAAIAILVLLGTLWSDAFTFPVIMNVVCGVILLLLGLVLLVIGLRWRKGDDTTDNETQP
jgi:putative Mn2+ efflux pump MntP